MQTTNSDTVVYLNAITVLVSIEALICACQCLTRYSEFKDDGRFGWTLFQTRRTWSRDWMVRIASPVMSYPGVLFLYGAQALAAGCLVLFNHHDVIRPVMLTLLWCCTLSLNLRNFPSGVIGADRMRMTVLWALWLREAAPGSHIATQACLWFIALQCCLSYLTTGMTKLLSAEWRSGEALRMIFSHRDVGDRTMAIFLQRRPLAALPMTWTVILLQLVFPLALLDLRICVVFLFAMLLFHVGNATLMGLNTFLWAWVSTFPAVLYATASMR